VLLTLTSAQTDACAHTQTHTHAFTRRSTRNRARNDAHKVASMIVLPSWLLPASLLAGSLARLRLCMCMCMCMCVREQSLYLRNLCLPAMSYSFCVVTVIRICAVPQHLCFLYSTNVSAVGPLGECDQACKSSHKLPALCLMAVICSATRASMHVSAQTRTRTHTHTYTHSGPKCSCHSRCAMEPSPGRGPHWQRVCVLGPLLQCAYACGAPLPPKR